MFHLVKKVSVAATRSDPLGPLVAHIEAGRVSQIFLVQLVVFFSLNFVEVFRELRSEPIATFPVSLRDIKTLHGLFRWTFPLFQSLGYCWRFCSTSAQPFHNARCLLLGKILQNSLITTSCILLNTNYPFFGLNSPDIIFSINCLRFCWLLFFVYTDPFFPPFVFVLLELTATIPTLKFLICLVHQMIIRRRTEICVIHLIQTLQAVISPKRIILDRTHAEGQSINIYDHIFLLWYHIGFGINRSIFHIFLFFFHGIRVFVYASELVIFGDVIFRGVKLISMFFFN